MIPWQITITKGRNGYKLTWVEELDEGVTAPQEHYIQEDEAEDEGELECMQDLLLEIKEFFGVYYSKHAKRNLRITIEGSDEEE